MLEARDSLSFVVYEMHNVLVHAVLTQKEIFSPVFSEYYFIHFKFPRHNDVSSPRSVGVIFRVPRHEDACESKPITSV
jgi:hypothetical protein